MLSRPPLGSLRAEADRISALGKELRERIDVLTDLTAAEAEVEAVHAAAEQRAATAEARAADSGLAFRMPMVRAILRINQMVDRRALEAAVRLLRHEW